MRTSTTFFFILLATITQTVYSKVHVEGILKKESYYQNPQTQDAEFDTCYGWEEFGDVISPSGYIPQNKFSNGKYDFHLVIFEDFGCTESKKIGYIEPIKPGSDKVSSITVSKVNPSGFPGKTIGGYKTERKACHGGKKVKDGSCK